MTMGDRIKKRLQELGWKQVELLDRVPDLGPGTLSAIIKRGSNQSVFANQIALALGVNLQWLLYGQGEKLIHTQNTEPGPNVKGLIPVISWVQAGEFCTSPDLLQPGDAEEWIPTYRNMSRHGYALRVKGDSMISPYPGQKSYPPGTIIFVDPERAVINGCKVVARIHDTEEATFKIYSEDSGKRYLRPINPQFPTLEMTDDMQLCGVVIGSWSEE